MKTLEDFPIGSMWKSCSTGGEYEVIDHTDVAIGKRHLLLKYTKASTTLSAYNVGDTFAQPPDQMKWAEPITQENTMKTVEDFPIGSMWRSSTGGEYKVIHHINWHLLLKYTKAGTTLTVYNVGDTFVQSPNSMKWVKPINPQQYNPTQEKNMKALVELAMAISDKEKTSDSVSPMVKKALEKHREEREEAASNDIVSLLRDIEQHKNHSRAQIKRLKAQVSGEVKKLNDLDRRWAYAEETSNFIPALAFFNLVNEADLTVPEDWDKLSQVPADWKPAAKE